MRAATGCASARIEWAGRWVFIKSSTRGARMSRNANWDSGRGVRAAATTSWARTAMTGVSSGLHRVTAHEANIAGRLRQAPGTTRTGTHPRWTPDVEPSERLRDLVDPHWRHGYLCGFFHTLVICHYRQDDQSMVSTTSAFRSVRDSRSRRGSAIVSVSLLVSPTLAGIY